MPGPQGTSRETYDQALLPFAGNGRLMRLQWHDGRWFFSVVDMVGLLTDSVRLRTNWSERRPSCAMRAFDESSAQIGQLTTMRWMWWRPVRELNPSLRLDKPLSLPMNERA